MSKSDMPSVPPANRSTGGPGNPATRNVDDHKSETVPRNTREQGRQGDIHQNTHHQGYQQDR
ncbi:hypothetical protein ABIE65_004697 [Constrictibacter sp. MBR-5]|jgi:hypothetical protein|uniref:hypothetical protein n=1 Tax=Constrictibacter sp. MBR-5 TaxID=3156467 RepID=UPI00339B7767